MRIQMEKLLNTRDLGGEKAVGGKTIKYGMLIRSGQLFGLSEADKTYLTNKLGLIIDFRTTKEKNEKPDPFLPGVKYIHHPVFSEEKTGITREKNTDKTAADKMAKMAEKSSPEAARRKMSDDYAEFIFDKSINERYRSFLKLVLENENKAVLWHCTAGKDRAGFASILIEYILGVDVERIKKNYLSTNEYIRPEVEWLYEFLLKDNKDPLARESLGYLFAADPAYFDRLFEEAEMLYGSFDGFIREALLVDDEMIKKFRDKFLE